MRELLTDDHGRAITTDGAAQRDVAGAAVDDGDDGHVFCAEVDPHAREERGARGRAKGGVLGVDPPDRLALHDERETTQELSYGLLERCGVSTSTGDEHLDDPARRCGRVRLRRGDTRERGDTDLREHDANHDDGKRSA